MKKPGEFPNKSKSNIQSQPKHNFDWVEAIYTQRSYHEVQQLKSAAFNQLSADYALFFMKVMEMRLSSDTERMYFEVGPL